MSAPALAGDLRVIPLADVLLLLQNNKRTGALDCSNAGITKTLEWENGEIVFARSTAPDDRLGAYLLARGTVTPDQLQQANPLVTNQDRLGKTLIRLGVLTPDTLWEAVRGQTTEIIYSLFHWMDGYFEFREGDPPQEKIALESSVMNLIMEGTRRLDEWSRVREKIQSDKIVLAPVKSLEEASGMVKMSDLERTVLGLVDARRTVREVVDLAGCEEFEAWQALYALLSAGVIRIQLLAFDLQGSPPAKAASGSSDAVLDRTLEKYGNAVTEILGRAELKEGAAGVSHLRKRIREATFARADLLRDAAIESHGRIDRRVLLANVAEDPPAEREKNLRAALDSLVKLLTTELKGKIEFDDVLAELKKK